MFCIVCQARKLFLTELLHVFHHEFTSCMSVYCTPSSLHRLKIAWGFKFPSAPSILRALSFLLASLPPPFPLAHHTSCHRCELYFSFLAKHERLLSQRFRSTSHNNKTLDMLFGNVAVYVGIGAALLASYTTLLWCEKYPHSMLEKLYGNLKCILHSHRVVSCALSNAFRKSIL